MATETGYQITSIRIRKYLWGIMAGWTLVIILLMAGTAFIETSLGPLPIHQRYELTLNIAALAGLWLVGTGGLIFVAARVNLIIADRAKVEQRLVAGEKAMRTLTEALQESEERFRTIFEKAPDAIFLADAESGTIIDANAAAETLLQKPKADIIGLHQTQLHPPAALEFAKNSFQKHMDESQTHPIHTTPIETLVVRAGGQEVPVEVVTSRITLNRRPVLMGTFRDISDRLKTEATLRKLSGVVEQTDDSVVITDKAGLIEYVNPAFERLTGYTAAEAIGQTPRILKSGQHPLEFYQNLWGTILSGQVFRDVVINKRKDGSLYSEEKTITPLTNIKNEITHFVSTGKDITARIETQQFFARRNRELEVLSKASRIFTTSLDLDSVLTTVLEEVRALLNITGCSIWLVDMQTDELVCRQATDPNRDIVRGWRLPAGKGLVGWAVAHKQRLNIPDAPVDTRHFSGVDQATGLEIRSILTIPLMTPVAVIGALQVVDTTPNRFTEVDVRLVESLANTTTTAIESARLYESLKESEEYTRRLIDSSLDIIIASDKNRRIIEFNPAAQAYFGYSHDEIIGRHASILYANPEQGNDIFQRACENGHCTTEVLNRRKDGTLFPAILSVSVLKTAQGELLGVMGIAKDISAQKEAESEKERLLAAESEQRRRAESLSEITLALAAHTNPEAVLDEIMQQIGILLPHATRHIVLLKNGSPELVRCAGPHKDSMIEAIESPLYAQTKFPIEEEMIRTRTPVLIPDSQADPHWVTLEPTAWIRSHIAIPITHHNRILGLLRLDSDTPHAFSEQDLERLTPLANAAAIALHNAQLYQQAIEDAQTKLILLNEVNHRVKNNLSAIIGLLYAEQNRLHPDSDKRYVQIMDNLIQRVQSLAAVHTLLSSQEWTAVSLNSLLRQIIHATRQSYYVSRPVNIVIVPSTIQVTPKQAHNLALIINELTINTFKHGRSIEHPEIDIKVSAWEADDRIWVEYRDNGPGYPARIIQKHVDDSQIGFHLINNILTKTLRGSLALRNDGGAAALFSFKIERDYDEF